MNPQPNKVAHLSLGCAHCRLKGVCLLEEMNESAEEILHKIVKRSHPVPKNTFLFRQGEPFEYVYSIKSGSFKSFMTDSNTHEQIVGFHFPGDLVGIDAIDKSHHTTATQALQDSSVCRMAWHDFKMLTETCKQFAIPPLTIASRELMHAHDQINALGQLSAEQKLAYFILEIAKRMEGLGFSKSQLNLSMSRNEIANYLGTAPETISRGFTTLQKKGLINVNRHNITIVQWEQLQALID